MNKINFEDLPSKTTPLSANNLNLMQNNIESAIMENRGVIKLVGTSSNPIDANELTGAGVFQVSGDKTNFYENDGTFILFVQIVENRGNVTLIQHMLTQNGLAIRTGTYEIIEQEIYWNFTNWELQSGSGEGDTLPIGAILQFSGDTAPDDFLFCRGQAVSRTTYSELFEAIGTQYGSGDGSTTFNLPDYSGKVAVGLDSNDTDFDTLGETGGEKTHTLTVDEMPSHDHTMQNHVLAYKGGGIDSSTSGIWKSSLEKTNSTGGSQAHNILQPYIVQNFIIKFKKTTITDGEVIQETDTATTENVYSASAVNNKLALKQDKIKFMTKQLTTDENGNASLEMNSNNYRILNVVAEGNTINGWITTYCFNNYYYVHAGQFNGQALSGTATFRITYIEI